jgi:hypothetical protein
LLHSSGAFVGRFIKKELLLKLIDLVLQIIILLLINVIHFSKILVLYFDEIEVVIIGYDLDDLLLLNLRNSYWCEKLLILILIGQLLNEIGGFLMYGCIRSEALSNDCVFWQLGQGLSEWIPLDDFSWRSLHCCFIPN